MVETEWVVVTREEAREWGGDNRTIAVRKRCECKYSGYDWGGNKRIAEREWGGNNRTIRNARTLWM